MRLSNRSLGLALLAIIGLILLAVVFGDYLWINLIRSGSIEQP